MPLNTTHTDYYTMSREEVDDDVGWYLYSSTNGGVDDHENEDGESPRFTYKVRNGYTYGTLHMTRRLMRPMCRADLNTLPFSAFISGCMWGNAEFPEPFTTSKNKLVFLSDVPVVFSNQVANRPNSHPYAFRRLAGEGMDKKQKIAFERYQTSAMF